MGEKKPVLIAKESSDRSCKRSDSPAVVFEKNVVYLHLSILEEDIVMQSAAC